MTYYSDLFNHIAGQPRSCSLREYMAVSKFVRAFAPTNFLVFGVGRDTSAWIRCNENGKTIFLENDPEWSKQIADHVPDSQIITVSYLYSFDEWQRNGFKLSEKLRLSTTKDVEETKWDMIFVDAPFGPEFGRQQSAFTACQLVRAGGLIAIHDCDRVREQCICRFIFDQLNCEVLHDIERIRIYKTPVGSS